MIETITYQIKLYSYWHTSSGLSAASAGDLVVLKNTDGLPTIKGRTLKGLLRDSAMMIHSFQENLVKEDFIKQVFGVGDDDHVKEERQDSNQVAEDSAKVDDKEKSNSGKAFFDDANVSENLANLIKEEDLDKKHFYTTIASTAMTAKGVAKSNALREIEVTIPLTLYATIHHEGEIDLEQLDYCFQGVKRLGLNRNRGLGYCEFSRLPKL